MHFIHVEGNFTKDYTNGVHASKSGVRIVNPIMSKDFSFLCVKYIYMYIVAICLILWD